MRNIRKRNFIKPEENIEVRIIFALIENKRAMTIYGVAKVLNEPSALIAYHIPHLLKKGILIAQRNKKYKLQPALYQLEKYIIFLHPLISQLWQDTVNPTEETIENILSSIFHLYSIE